MNRTYLIQRLKEPPKTEWNNKVDSIFSFGCVGRGGFKEEAWNILTKIFSFDYMGSAEFEFGAVPQAFSEIYKSAKKKNLISGTIEFKDFAVKEIYYLCDKSIEEYAKTVIHKLSLKKSDLFLKEYPQFRETLEGDKWASRIKGWIELDNVFMFFVDKEMYERTKELFTLE